MHNDADDSNPLTSAPDITEDTAERSPRGRDSLETRNCRSPRAGSTLPMWLDARATTEPTIWRAGDRVDRYELIEQIGVGGMGVVWAALDLDLGREVAIKLSFPQLHVRLLGEAQAMARLSHPNVVTVHDVGWTHDGLFIAMERIDGGTLGDWLRALPRAWDEVIEKFAAAGRGLAAAHRAGLVHRDFKPENVLVGKDGVARVSDFGLALPLGEARADGVRGTAGGRQFTQEVAPVGTLAYMAPEQLCGYDVTPRSDQFSFCLALHEALYRATAFGPAWSEAPAVFFLAAAAEGRIAPPPPDSRVPARIRDIVMRGLAYQPDERWPSMEAVVAELERCLPRGPRKG